VDLAAEADGEPVALAGVPDGVGDGDALPVVDAEPVTVVDADATADGELEPLAGEPDADGEGVVVAVGGRVGVGEPEPEPDADADEGSPASVPTSLGDSARA
jgi:hypothetical protein